MTTHSNKFEAVVISSHTILKMTILFYFPLDTRALCVCVCLSTMCMCVVERVSLCHCSSCIAVKRMAIISFVVSGHLIFLCAPLYTVCRMLFLPFTFSLVCMVPSIAINLNSRNQRRQHELIVYMILLFPSSQLHRSLVVCVSISEYLSNILQ